MSADVKRTGLLAFLCDKELALLGINGFIEQPMQELFRRYNHRLFCFIFWQSAGNIRLTENVISSTWEQVLQHCIKHHHLGTDFQTHLFQIAHTQWFEIKPKLSEPFAAEDTDSNLSPIRQKSHEVIQTLLALPDEAREMCVLHCGCNMATAEIAAIVGKDMELVAHDQEDAILDFMRTIEKRRGSDPGTTFTDQIKLSEQLKAIFASDQIESANHLSSQFAQFATELDSAEKSKRERQLRKIAQGQSVTSIFSQEVSSYCVKWIEQQARADYALSNRRTSIWDDLGWVAIGAILAGWASYLYIQQQPSGMENLILQTMHEVTTRPRHRISIQPSQNNNIPNQDQDQDHPKSSILAFILLVHLKDNPRQVATRLPITPNTQFRIFCSNPDDKPTQQWVEQLRRNLQQRGHSATIKLVAGTDLQKDALRIIALTLPTHKKQ